MGTRLFRLSATDLPIGISIIENDEIRIMFQDPGDQIPNQHLQKNLCSFQWISMTLWFQLLVHGALTWSDMAPPLEEKVVPSVIKIVVLLLVCPPPYPTRTKYTLKKEFDVTMTGCTHHF